MINANELRIGNWVNFTYNHKSKAIQIPCKVYELRRELVTLEDKHDLITVRFEAIQPVDLTPEILEKCGFENNDGEFTHPNNTDFDLMFCASENGLWCGYNFGDLKGIAPFQGPLTGVVALPICNPFKYVHQLQNLYFALTGEELKIEL